MEIIPELKNIGLDENEIKVYIACLKTGRSKVNEISKKSGLNRTTTYGVLKSLKEKGFISSILKDNIKHFQAADPEHLVDILEERKSKIEDVLPQLKKMEESVHVKHKVEFFEGRRGLKTVINDLTKKSNCTVKILGSYTKFHKFSKSFAKRYHRERKRKNIHVEAIVADTKNERKAKKDEKEELRETRFIQIKPLESECYIYRNKIAFVSFEEDNLRGVMIEDKKLSHLQNILFDNLWERSEK